MSLAVDVTHRFGSFLLEARFVSAGRLTAFFGRPAETKRDRKSTRLNSSH